MTTDTTFAQSAQHAVREFHGVLEADPDSMVNCSMLFLIDYEHALNWKHTDEDMFLAAYYHRALAIMHGASEKALDAEAYRLRQEWARKWSTSAI
jgi:hypothetical protein